MLVSTSVISRLRTELFALPRARSLSIWIAVLGTLAIPASYASDLYRIVPISSDQAFDNAYVNDRGVVIVTINDGGTVLAAMWDRGTLTLLPAIAGQTGSSASAIDNRGQIVGDAAFNQGPYQPYHAVLWSHGQVVDLTASLAAAGQPYPIAGLGGINSQGQIAGQGYLNVSFGDTVPVLIENGTVTNLGTPGVPPCCIGIYGEQTG
jgi:hypothetical protein